MYGRGEFKAVSVAVTGAGVLFLLGCGATPARHVFVPESARVELAGNCSFVFQRLGTHYFQAEYSRQLRLTNSNHWHKLPKSGGSAINVDVFHVKTSDRRFLLLEDAGGTYLLDVDSDVLYLVVKAGGEQFISILRGESPVINAGQSRASDRPEWITTVEVDNEPAARADSLLGPLPDFDYVGVICGGTGSLGFLRSPTDTPELDRPLAFLNDQSGGS